MPIKRLSILFIAMFFTLVLYGAETAFAAGPPPNPTVYAGKITVGNAVPADSVVSMQIYCDDNKASSGLCDKKQVGKWVKSAFGNRLVCEANCVFGKVGKYVSDGGIITNGNYVVTVGPPDARFAGMAVSFHFDHLVLAEQSENFNIQSSMIVKHGYQLTFPTLPTPTPTPTNTPTPTPVIPRFSVYSGLVFSAGGNVPGGASLQAKIGNYESQAIGLKGTSYTNLIVDPQDSAAVGKKVEFYLNGVLSRTVWEFSSGEVVSDLDLVFVGLPTVVPATNTPVPATVVPATNTAVPATVMPATNTPVPATVMPATNTPVPATMMPATNTPVPATVMPATNTPVPATVVPAAAATSVPPSLETPTPTPRVVPYEPSRQDEEPVKDEPGGGCNRVGPTSSLNGAANALMMVAPLLLVAGYRGWRKRRL